MRDDRLSREYNIDREATEESQRGAEGRVTDRQSGGGKNFCAFLVTTECGGERGSWTHRCRKQVLPHHVAPFLLEVVNHLHHVARLLGGQVRHGCHVAKVLGAH